MTSKSWRRIPTGKSSTEVSARTRRRDVCRGNRGTPTPQRNHTFFSRAGERGGDRGAPARAWRLETRSTPRFEVGLLGADPDPSFKLRSPLSLEVHLPQRAVRHGFDAGRQRRDLSFGGQRALQALPDERRRRGAVREHQLVGGGKCQAILCWSRGNSDLSIPPEPSRAQSTDDRVSLVLPFPPTVLGPLRTLGPSSTTTSTSCTGRSSK